MKKQIYLMLVMVFLGLSPALFAWPEDGIVTLKMLLDGEVTVAQLIEHQMTVRELIESYENDKNITSKVRRKFLSDNKRKITKLEEDEKKALRLAKRENIVRKNKQFYGDPELACDASPEDLRCYDEVIAVMREQLKQGLINQSTFDACLETINSLRFLHQNNRQICLEYSRSTRSNTYGDRVSLHPAERDVEFHLKAGLMYSWLWPSFKFALEYNLLAEMFNDGLSKNNGCLEARFRALSDWYKSVSSRMKGMKNMSPNSKANALIKPAYEAAMGYIEANFESIGEELGTKATIEEIARNIAHYFEGKNDALGEGVTFEVALLALKTVFSRNSPIKSPIKKVQIPHENSPVRRRLFSNEDLIQANRASLKDIVRVLTAHGVVRVCKLKETAPDGNCGFSALGIVTREDFIARVLLERNSNDPRIQELIQAAMLQVGAPTLEEWAQIFADPSHWMDETIMNLYALIYDVRVHVHAVDHTENIFRHIATINPEGARLVNIVHVLLEPIEHEGQLALNHYDALDIEEEELIAVDLVLPHDEDFPINLDIVDRTGFAGFFGK